MEAWEAWVAAVEGAIVINQSEPQRSGIDNVRCQGPLWLSRICPRSAASQSRSLFYDIVCNLL